jgi:hypothetical protein
MANFLVVCGGAGRGILRYSDQLGFDASLHIDVHDEIPRAADSRFFSVDLSLLLENMTNSEMMRQRGIQLTENIAKLDTEITDIESTIAQSSSQSNKDGGRKHTTDAVDSLDVRLSFLSRQRDALRNRLNHLLKVRSFLGPRFPYEMRIMPSVFRAFIEGDKQTQAITDALTNMMNLTDAGDGVVTFWVVASVCGGVGQGIYTHVIDQIHNVMQSFPNKRLKIKVIRIGSLTYMSISPKVNLNAFWSLVTDYGYIKTHLEKSQKGELQSLLNYYYLDLPDVGAGNAAIEKREAIVASAFKALTHKQLDRQFEVVFNNLVFAPKVVLARIGEWGQEFRQDSVYEQTIMELQQKLTQLLTPEPADVLGKIVSFEKSYNGNSVFDLKEVERRLTPQVINSLKEIPKLTQAIRVAEIEQREEWSRIVSFVEQSLTQLVSSGFLNTASFSVDLTTRNNVSIAFSPSTNRTKIFNETYIREVELAQIAVTKFDQLMTIQNNEEGLYKKLVDAYNAMRKPGFGGMFASNDDKLKHALVNISAFLMQYAYIAKIIAEYKNASKIIDLARQELTTVTNVISIVHGTIVPNASTQAVTMSAALHESFGGTKTWLQILDENLRGNPDVARRSPAFRHAVQMGARSLTESGLKQVLNVPVNTSTQQIVAQINDHIGAQGSYWWQGIVPNFAAIPSQFRFKFRVFPQLPEQMFALMQQENLALSQSRGVDAPVYIESADNRYGLNIYGVECIAAGLSITDQFEQLIQQFTGVIYPGNAFFQNTDYIGSNCLVTPGTPIFFPSDVSSHNAALNSVKEFLTETMASYVTVVTDEF